MKRTILRRMLLACLLILAASALTFALVAAAPGNVAALIAERAAGPGADAEMITRIGNELGLHDPLPTRYGRWLASALAGDFGISLRTGKPISQEFAARIPMTAALLAGGGVLAFVLSITLGIAGAVSNGGFMDRFLHAFSLIGASTPNFFVAALLVIVFSVMLGWVPTFGTSGLTSWLLPWVTIALFPASVLSRVVRVNLQEAMSRPFATTGFAKGYTRTQVLLREALPNIAIPFLTTFGAQFTLMIIGSIVVETVFALRGVGAFFIEAIRFRDFIGMQSVLLLFVVFFVMVNFIVDMICIVVDPRMRRARGA
ncbi:MULTISPECIES: ABC transporter permease [unclassified Mesorhizobium]|uniref:ABC transporter permease n=1 Tax=unclassified Mesorhizobium TaxID=325217 RepID=UPI0003CEAAB4|nr:MULTISPECIES: ABC transporter permease [unclassified Mesorhizobium]ESX27424.1 nickel ABC transporter permease [Mesorhizobium sp. LSHC440B00]ESX35916.1 nickel ABC transporter permease [Mesorhizobium sp. LSHC432A00]ESX41321.1 nickel ABC transporter permease [Mesorhizobium sp. LSHC440A00]WJI55555.1 ABC transporter permease [Mesorhizobium sp. C432A]